MGIHKKCRNPCCSSWGSFLVIPLEQGGFPTGIPTWSHPEVSKSPFPGWEFPKCPNSQWSSWGFLVITEQVRFPMGIPKVSRFLLLFLRFPHGSWQWDSQRELSQNVQIPAAFPGVSCGVQLRFLGRIRTSHKSVFGISPGDFPAFQSLGMSLACPIPVPGATWILGFQGISSLGKIPHPEGGCALNSSFPWEKLDLSLSPLIQPGSS